MMIFISIQFAFIPSYYVFADNDKLSNNQCVILLHGLARTKGSMRKMENQLTKNGYDVINVDYPSRKYSIEDLSEQIISNNISKCKSRKSNTIHFVTHSLGGIVVRYYLSKYRLNNLGRVVMLSPPNQGSEAVDKLKILPGFSLINGKAGRQLGTDENSMPLQLGPVDFNLGIITGDRSLNLFLSLLIPGKDDGKVSIENAKVDGMSDFIVLPYTHPFIMKSDEAIKQTVYFLKYGEFDKNNVTQDKVSYSPIYSSN